MEYSEDEDNFVEEEEEGLEVEEETNEDEDNFVAEEEEGLEVEEETNENEDNFVGEEEEGLGVEEEIVAEEEEGLEVEQVTNGLNYPFDFHDDDDDDFDWERKRPTSLSKRCKSPGEDIISRLPDSIIHQILSLLPMEDAVKTGVLSNRWKYLWTSISTLNFCYDGDKYHSFFQFIDKTLILYSSSKVKKFSLSFDYPAIDPDVVDVDSIVGSVGLLLRFATRHDVEDLSLVLNKNEMDYPYSEDYDRYLIPRYLYVHPLLTNLTTRFCDHAPKADVSWALLKVLNIGEAALTERGFQRILAGTPLLEHLELNRCWGINSIQISSTSALKKLVIKAWLDHTEEPLQTLEISVPSVKSLELLGHWQMKCLLLDASSLVEAIIDFEPYWDIQEYEGMVKKMLQKVTLVHRLTVGHMFIQFFGDDEENISIDEEENYWSSKEQSFRYLFQQLKTIEIVGLDPTENIRNYPLFQFAEFILQKSRVLEKIVILGHPHRKRHDFYGVARKFLRFHRCSPNAEVILPE